MKRPAAKGEQCPLGIIADERGGCESDALIADDEAPGAVYPVGDPQHGIDPLEREEVGARIGGEHGERGVVADAAMRFHAHCLTNHAADVDHRGSEAWNCARIFLHGYFRLDALEQFSPYRVGLQMLA